MVPFAGWEMPVQYPAGILAEHQHCRAAAALFDVSHMGQVRLDGADAAAALERLVPGDIQWLGTGPCALHAVHRPTRRHPRRPDRQPRRRPSVPGRQCRQPRRRPRPSARGAGAGDAASPSSPTGRCWRCRDRRPAAVLARLAPAAAELRFMSTAEMDVDGLACRVSRLGYTGEDGFEISVAAGDAETLARRLLAEPEVAARRPGCARLAAPGGRPAAVRPRHRHHHDAGRGRPRLVDRQAAARGGRLRRCRDHPGASSREGTAAPPGRL